MGVSGLGGGQWPCLGWVEMGDGEGGWGEEEEAKTKFHTPPPSPVPERDPRPLLDYDIKM